MIEHRLLTMLECECDVAPMPTNTRLLRDAGLDSLGFVQIVAWIEATFHFQVRDDEMVPGNLMTVDRIANYIRRRMGRDEIPLVDDPGVPNGETK